MSFIQPKRIKSNRIFKFIDEKLLSVGTDGLQKDQYKRTKLINTICAITAFLAFTIGYVFYINTGFLERILIPAWIEGALFCLVIYCNGKRQYMLASIGLMIIHCLSAIYFAFTLGQLINVTLIVGFLFGLSFLIYSKTSHRVIGITAILLTLFVIEFNDYQGYIKPIAMPIDNQLLFRWVALPCFLFFLGMVLFYNQYEIGKLFRQLERFVEKVAHDLRTILSSNAILLGLLKKETEKKKPDYEMVRSYVKQLSTIQENMTMIVHEVLGNGKSGVNKDFDETFSLEDLLENVIATHRHSAIERAITICSNYSYAMPPYIVSDTGRINTILNNLLSNAIKYADRHSEVTITVSRAEDYFSISIANQCEPIPPDKLYYLFDEFVMAKKDKRTMGNGLGLYYVRCIVEDFKGTYHVSSNEKETVFEVKLPLKEGTLDVVFEENEINFNFEGYRIFLAEDDPMFNNLLGKFLNELGCKISGFFNGQDLLRILNEHAKSGFLPGCIILDDSMPIMTGYETLQEIRHNVLYDQIPIIILSGLPDISEVKNKFLKAGATDVIEKPVSFSTLKKILSQHLQQVTDTD